MILPNLFIQYFLHKITDSKMLIYRTLWTSRGYTSLKSMLQLQFILDCEIVYFHLIIYANVLRIPMWWRIKNIMPHRPLLNLEVSLEIIFPFIGRWARSWSDGLWWWSLIDRQQRCPGKLIIPTELIREPRLWHYRSQRVRWANAMKKFYYINDIFVLGKTRCQAINGVWSRMLSRAGFEMEWTVLSSI